MKKLVFVSHPVSGNPDGNTKKVLEICGNLFRQGVIPVAPYLIALQVLDDGVVEERRLGMETNHVYIERIY